MQNGCEIKSQMMGNILCAQVGGAASVPKSQRKQKRSLGSMPAIRHVFFFPVISAVSEMEGKRK